MSNKAKRVVNLLLTEPQLAWDTATLLTKAKIAGPWRDEDDGRRSYRATVPAYGRGESHVCSIGAETDRGTRYWSITTHDDRVRGKGAGYKGEAQSLEEAKANIDNLLDEAGYSLVGGMAAKPDDDRNLLGEWEKLGPEPDDPTLIVRVAKNGDIITRFWISVGRDSTRWIWSTLTQADEEIKDTEETREQTKTAADKVAREFGWDVPSERVIGPWVEEEVSPGGLRRWIREDLATGQTVTKIVRWDSGEYKFWCSTKDTAPSEVVYRRPAPRRARAGSRMSLGLAREVVDATLRIDGWEGV